MTSLLVVVLLIICTIGLSRSKRLSKKRKQYFRIGLIAAVGLIVLYTAFQMLGDETVSVKFEDNFTVSLHAKVVGWDNYCETDYIVVTGRYMFSKLGKQKLELPRHYTDHCPPNVLGGLPDDKWLVIKDVNEDSYKDILVIADNSRINQPVYTRYLFNPKALQFELAK